MSLDTLSNALLESASNFRIGREALANRQLAALFDLMSEHLSQLNTAEQAHIQQVLPQLFTAQKRRDLLYLADLLQYELRPMFLTPRI